jgi:hypothetical protein
LYFAQSLGLIRVFMKGNRREAIHWDPESHKILCKVQQIGAVGLIRTIVPFLY